MIGINAETDANTEVGNVYCQQNTSIFVTVPMALFARNLVNTVVSVSYNL